MLFDIKYLVHVEIIFFIFNYGLWLKYLMKKLYDLIENIFFYIKYFLLM